MTPQTFGEGWRYFWAVFGGEFALVALCGFVVASAVFDVALAVTKAVASACWRVLVGQR